MDGYYICKQEKNFMHIITSYDFMTRNGQYIYLDCLNLLCTTFFYVCFKDENRFNFFKNKFIVDVGSRITYSSYVYQYIFTIPVVFFVFPLFFKKLQIGRFPSEVISLFLSISGLLLFIQL